MQCFETKRSRITACLFPPFYTGIPQVKAANYVTHPVIIGNLSGILNNVTMPACEPPVTITSPSGIRQASVESSRS